MADIVDQNTRSRMMAGIKSRNTAPELILRRGLHGLGFRFRLHVATLPGKPDIVFPSRKAVVFIHGCFWHGHSCHLFRWPSSRMEFWRKKIVRNREKDAENEMALIAVGWRILTVWECAIKGRTRLSLDEMIQAAATWLINGEENIVLQGTQ